MVDEAVKQRMEEYERREGPWNVESRHHQLDNFPCRSVHDGRQGGTSWRRKGAPLIRRHCSGRLVYAKPFVAAPKAIVGGYMDIQYRAQRKASIENGYGGGTNGLTSNVCPFIYADITEHVKFASELEIEHGIRAGDSNEISLEFAHIDYLVNEPSTFGRDSAHSHRQVQFAA